MSKQDEYKLTFGERKIDGTVYYSCSRWGESKESFYLARLLDESHRIESVALLEEINNALNRKEYEAYFPLNVSSVNVEIAPPNIILENELAFPLSEMKLLLEEWIRFCKS